MQMVSQSPHVVEPGRSQLAARFADETLRQELVQRRLLGSAQMTPDEMQQAGLVGEVIEGFHSFWPLEDLSACEDGPSAALGVYSAAFKATSSIDGQPYFLRRINGRQVVPSQEMTQVGQAVVERWLPLARHPALCVPRYVCITSDMDSLPSLVFVHDLHAGAMTLEATHIQPVPDQRTGALVRNQAAEPVLWSYLVQLASALHAAHNHGLAIRPASLDPSKVLVTVLGRVRVSSLGVVDVLRGEVPPPAPPQAEHMFAQDLQALGQLMLALMCAGASPTPSVEIASRSYSPELCRVVSGLLDGPSGGGLGSADQLVAAIAGRMCIEMGSLGASLDRVTSDLERELENGRIARLLIKLGMCAGRPLQDLGLRTEVGDRYLVGLLQEFLFAQTNEAGTPMLDWGHVLEGLTKLDAGVPERVTMVGRDERSLVVASYAELRRALESCYQGLVSVSLSGRMKDEASFM